MKKLFFVLGTRPEIIKISPILNLNYKKKKFKQIVIFTGQHTNKNMSEEFFKLFKINYDYNLSINKNLSLNEKYAEIIKGLDRLFTINKPDGVYVCGDTNTALAASQAAMLNKIPLFYFESGLRTYDDLNPWPEEINRRLISSLATYHFAPTYQNKKNLIKENFDGKKIFITGNTVIDAVKKILKNKIYKKKIIEFEKKLSVDFKKTLILTLHRREVFGKKLEIICNDIIKFVNLNPDYNIIIPIHPNPVIKNFITKKFLNLKKNIKIIAPLSYPLFIYLCKSVSLILTDSGGVQEESTILKKRIIVLRTVTERPEAKNYNIFMAPILKDNIYNLIIKILKKKKIKKIKYFFGNGNSTNKIVKIINKLI